MPRLDADMEMGSIGSSGFNFSNVGLDKLGSSRYTLVTVAVDTTGSVGGFIDEIEKMLESVYEGCKKSPSPEALLIRVIVFNSSLINGISELHGFKLIDDIQPSYYRGLVAQGMTPLYNAIFSSVGATMEMARKLDAEDYMCNGIIFIITDGDDNDSSVTPKMIKDEVGKMVTGEEIESITTILIGINTGQYSSTLKSLVSNAGLSEYLDAGDVTPKKLARLANLISQSVSSTSAAIITGTPSQTTLTI